MSESERDRIRREKAAKDQHDASDGGRARAPKSYFGLIIAAVEAAIQQSIGKREEAKADKEWDHKWRKREVWGLWIAAGVGLIAIIVSSVDSHNQKVALDAQRDVMRGQLNQMAADQRAWMKIESVSPGEDKWTGGGLQFWAKTIPGMLQLNIVIKNVGRGPAFNVRVGVWPIFGYGEKVEDLLGREERSCATLDTNPTKPMMSDGEGPIVVIFPGETQAINSLGVSIWPKDLAKFSTPNAARGRVFQLWFYGCIRYTLPGSPKPHETTFAYGVGHLINAPIPGGQALDVQLDPWVSIPAANLRFDAKPMAFGPTN